MNELAYKVLRDHAEGWFKRAQDKRLPADERAANLKMARGFLEWSRRMREQTG